jgi:hypothetical protein
VLDLFRRLGVDVLDSLHRDLGHLSVEPHLATPGQEALNEGRFLYRERTSPFGEWRGRAVVLGRGGSAAIDGVFLEGHTARLFFGGLDRIDVTGVLARPHDGVGATRLAEVVPDGIKRLGPGEIRGDVEFSR